jgi:hypothetical protein
MRHFFDMTGNGQPAKRRLRAALSEKLWDMCVCVCGGGAGRRAQPRTRKYDRKTRELSVQRKRTNSQQKYREKLTSEE